MEVSVAVHTEVLQRHSYRGAVTVAVPVEELRAVFEYELGNHHDPWQYLIVFRRDENTERKRHFFSLDGPISAQGMSRRLCALLLRLCREGLSKTIRGLELGPQDVKAAADLTFERTVAGKSDELVRRLIKW